MSHASSIPRMPSNASNVSWPNRASHDASVETREAEPQVGETTTKFSWRRTWNKLVGLTTPTNARHRGSAAHIHHYAPVFIPGFDANDQPSVALRSFYWHDEAQLLTVNIDTLATRRMQTALFRTRLPITQATRQTFVSFEQVESSAYGRTRARYLNHPQLLFNAGLTHSDADSPAMFLTVNLCPSHRAFEQRFFSSLVERSKVERRPLPVAICLSGLWAHAHPQELDWLQTQHDNKRLDITWVNHSFSHAHDPNRPLTPANFMLSPGVNFLYEIYETERMLLARDATPSVFFRFPGLLADERCLRELHRLGLIPLGADARLAQEEGPTWGSIVSVHGNSMEPLGIQRAKPWVEDKTIPWRSLAVAARQVAANEPEQVGRS